MTISDSTKHVFYLLFYDLAFPYEAFNVFDIEESIKTRKEQAKYIAQSDIKIRIERCNGRAEIIKPIIQGLLKNFSPSEQIYSLIQSSPVIKKHINIADDIKSLLKYNDENTIFIKEDIFTWISGSYWPSAYKRILIQFLNILNFYCRRVESISNNPNSTDVNQLFELSIRSAKSKKKTIENRKFASEFPRHMPTELHYAAAAIGEWIGGAISVQYFSLYAVKPLLLKPFLNLEYGVKVGYSEEDMQELNQSGFFCIPFKLFGPLMSAQGDYSVFGSIPINEFNPANFPNEIPEHPKVYFEKNGLAGLIIDKYYRNTFYAKPLDATALYGKNDVLRDHYSDFYRSITPLDFMRCKNYIAPIIEVETLGEMEEIVKRILKRGSGGLFFRGQTTYYQLIRGEKVKQLLFGDSNSNEPSLGTAASRTNFDYDKLHFLLKNFVADNYISCSQKSESKEIWLNLCDDPTCKLDYSIMALAQHYGIPSHGLDVTTSLDVALWFAINKYQSVGNKASYKFLEASDWEQDKNKWPVIFVFQTVLNTTIQSLNDCQELEELDIVPLRPKRQEAKFFLGGHSDHQNRLAEAVVCAFRLKPAKYLTKVDFDYLFPNKEIDPTYDAMLQFERSAKNLSNLKFTVNDFHL